jgi:hypothetical protein
MKKHEEGLKAFEGVAWFKDEFGYLKKGSKAQPWPPPEELFNLNGSNLIKTIHNCHQTSILKKDSIPPMKGNEDLLQGLLGYNAGTIMAQRILNAT